MALIKRVKILYCLIIHERGSLRRSFPTVNPPCLSEPLLQRLHARVQLLRLGVNLMLSSSVILRVISDILVSGEDLPDPRHRVKQWRAFDNGMMSRDSVSSAVRCSDFGESKRLVDDGNLIVEPFIWVRENGLDDRSKVGGGIDPRD